MNNSFNIVDWRRKYNLVAEIDSETEKSTEPTYNPEQHRTPEGGIGTYKLEGDKIVADVAFEEEPDSFVKVTFPKSWLENELETTIEDDEALQAIDSETVNDFIHDKYSGLFGSYWKTKHGKDKRQGEITEKSETSMLDLYERYTNSK